MADIIWSRGYSPAEAERGKFVALDETTLTNLPSSSRGRYAIVTCDIAGTDSSGAVLGTSANPMHTTITTIVSNVEVDVAGIMLNETISAVNCTVSTFETNPITSISAIQMGEWNIGALTDIISTVNVSEVNPVTAVDVINTVNVSEVNPVTAVDVINTVNVSEVNPVTAVDVINTVTVQENSAIRVIMTKDLTIPNTIWIGSSSLAAGVEYVPSLANELLEIEIQNKTEGPVYFLASATDYIGVESNGITIESDTFYSTRKYISEFTIGSLSGGDVRIIGHYNNEV